MARHRKHEKPLPTDKLLLLAWSAGAIALYALTWPSHALVADEVAYLNDALRLLERPLPCDAAGWSGYPPGTAMAAAIIICSSGCVGAVFAVGMLAWLVGLWSLGGALRRYQRPMGWALYAALFVPGVVLTRTLMSDLPSFGLAGLFLWAYTAWGHRRRGALCAGLCAGAALLFRETNLLWAVPFLVGALWRCHPRAGWLWTGFGLGAAARLLWAILLFGSPTYVRDPGVGFSWAYLPKNLFFYTLALTVLCPAGVFFLVNRKMPFWPEVVLGIISTLALYSCYGYDAFAKSGSLKGMVLQGRFLLPLVPFVTFAGAFSNACTAYTRLLPSLALMAALLYGAVQIGGKTYNHQQQILTAALLRQPTAVHWSLSYDESRKFLNALHTDACLRPLPPDNPPPTVAYVHLFTRNDSPDWHKKNALFETALKQLRARRALILLFDHTLLDGTRLRIWRAEPTDPL